ncbi:MAG TPA: hydrogen peroxide-dependent heme synthase [Solirubrobacterales bacterium]|nr:hydrogen peroxide-dependent heme synthase [Solirubrobacterales bacterium]
MALAPGNGSEPAAEEEAYVAYCAFKARGPAAGAESPAAVELAAEAESALGHVTVRGGYDLTGFRAEADVLLWLIANDPVALQDSIAAFGRSGLGSMLELWWSAIGVHRPAEFNKSHLPAFIEGRDPLPFVCVYPYVRTHDWYLLAPDERAALLAEHGRMGREYPQVQANTVSAFGLGDYEWLLAFEADRLSPITDLMRHLRSAGARRYTRHELPFLTGRRRPLAEIAELVSPSSAARLPAP